jgi:D-3-phosphoglycerate dehydrogenase / 2-oxoglutarate reductase
MGARADDAVRAPSVTTVAFTDFTFPDLEYEIAAAEEVGAEVRQVQAKSEAQVMEAARGADVLVVQFASITPRVIDLLAPGARIIRYGVGYDNVDVGHARERGVDVAYVPDYCTDEVAEHTTALLLALLRKLLPLHEGVRSGTWSAVSLAAPILPFSATTIGFVGLGRIGSTVLERLRPHGFRFLVFDPHLDAEHATRLGFQAVTFDELLREADAITLHAPLTKDTRHVIDAAALQRMKRTAFVVNTSRGELIDADALAAALREGVIAGAALDVFEREPLPEDAPLRDAPNLLLSPHAAWYSTHAIQRLQRLVADEIKRAVRGEPPRCPVPEPKEG